MDALAAEMAAFANCEGGRILIGIGDNGELQKIFDDALAFVMRNLQKIQAGRSVNAPGLPEIPESVFEELLVNALVHRDYLVSAPVRLFVYDNRIEATEAMGEILGITKRAVLKQVNKLKAQNRLRRVGAARGGYWEVIEQVRENV